MIFQRWTDISGWCPTPVEHCWRTPNSSCSWILPSSASKKWELVERVSLWDFSDGSRNKLVCSYLDIYMSYHVIIIVLLYIYAICSLAARYICVSFAQKAQDLQEPGPGYSFNCRGTLHPSQLCKFPELPGVDRHHGSLEDSSWVFWRRFLSDNWNLNPMGEVVIIIPGFPGQGWRLQWMFYDLLSTGC